jgi:hypothetical protein
LSSPEVNARIQIAGEFARLAQQRASGALEIGGSPGGTIFMSGGYLAFAETSAVPDLRSRLISSQRLSASQWREVMDSEQAHGVGTLLVSREIITINELRALLRSITLDALVALAALPPSAEPPAVGVRFWPRRSHWVGSLLRLDIASQWADAGQRAQRLALRGIPADARPQPRDLDRPWAVVRDGPWMVACQADGQTTVKDLAWRNGFPLCDALDWVGDLVQAGLCSLAAPDAPAAEEAASPAVTETAAAEPGPRGRGPLHRPRFGDRRARHERDQDRPGQGPRPPSRSESGKEQPAPEPVNGAAGSADAADDATVPLPHRNPGATLVARAAARSARAKPPGVIPRLPAVIQPSRQPDLWHRILRGLRRVELHKAPSQDRKGDRVGPTRDHASGASSRLTVRGLAHLANPAE